ncbi:MAG: hypothetical protein OXC11_13520 [Rhodospirillales bacterium]|nr:hypothetical protein [Rhodospirillales bacterium]
MSDHTIDSAGRKWRVLPVIRSENQNCGHCFNFATTDSEDADSPGECRLYAPRPENALRWPVVGPTDFCGQGSWRAELVKATQQSTGTGSNVTPMPN